MTEIFVEHIEQMGSQRVMAIQWGQYLVDTFGERGCLDTVALYKDFGWISEDVRNTMEDILTGSPNESHVEYDKPQIDWPPLNELKDSAYEDHAYSIAYIIELSDANTESLDGADLLT